MLLEKMSAFAAKVEDAAGEPESLTVSEGVYNIYDLVIDPNVTFRERAKQGGFNRLASVPEGYLGQAKFKMDLIAGSATPAWAGVLLAGCGIGLDSGDYVLDPVPVGGVGSTQKTLTLGQYEHGRMKMLYGAMGNLVFTFPSAKVVSLDFTFEGVYDEVTDVEMIAPSYPTDPPLFFTTQTFSVDSWSPQVSQLTLDIGNKVYVRPGQSATGYQSACIPDRLPKLTMDPEASLVADYDAWGLWRAFDEASSVTWLCEGGADTATFAATKLQTLKLSRAAREGVLVDQVEAQLNADDLAITFAHSSS